MEIVMRQSADRFFWITTLVLFAIYLATCVALYDFGGIIAALMLVGASLVVTYIATRTLRR